LDDAPVIWAHPVKMKKEIFEHLSKPHQVFYKICKEAGVFLEKEEFNDRNERKH